MKQIFFCCFWMFSATLFSQRSETIGTVRPGFTIGANTVGKNVLQFQQGFRFQREFLDFTFPDEIDPFYGFVQEGGKSRTFYNDLIPENTIRFGFVKNWELSAVVNYQFKRAIREYENATPDKTQKFEQWNALDFGGRYNILNLKSGTSLALQFRMGFAEYLRQKNSRALQPKFILAATQQIGDLQNVGLNLGYSTFLGDSPVYRISARDRFTFSSFGFQLEGNFEYDAFLNEFFANYDLGVFWQITSDIQLDAIGGLGHGTLALNHRTWFLGTGISWRIHPY